MLVRSGCTDELWVPGEAKLVRALAGARATPILPHNAAALCGTDNKLPRPTNPPWVWGPVQGMSGACNWPQRGSPGCRQQFILAMFKHVRTRRAASATQPRRPEERVKVGEVAMPIGGAMESAVVARSPVVMSELFGR